jgi:GR25 family glycosyltransferase involved in LPS biosynthesis
MLRQLSRTTLEYQIINAVDGITLDLSDPALASADWLRQVGGNCRELGCELSHLRACEAVLEAHVASALILEDDIVLPPNISQILDEAANYLDTSEALLLSLSTPDAEPCKVSNKGAVRLSSGHMIVYPMDLARVTGARAYVITAEACQRMGEQRLPLQASADDWAWFYSRRVLDRVRCLMPLPVKNHPSFNSTISHGRYSWRDSVYDFLEHVPLPPVKLLVTLRRQRFFKRTSSLELVEEPSPYFASGTPLF